MRNIKDIKAEVNTITYDKDKIEEKVGRQRDRKSVV